MKSRSHAVNACSYLYFYSMLPLDEFYRGMVDPRATAAVTTLAGEYSNMRLAGLQWRYVLNGSAPVLSDRVLLGKLQ